MQVSDLILGIEIVIPTIVAIAFVTQNRFHIHATAKEFEFQGILFAFAVDDDFDFGARLAQNDFYRIIDSHSLSRNLFGRIEFISLTVYRSANLANDVSGFQSGSISRTPLDG